MRKFLIAGAVVLGIVLVLGLTRDFFIKAAVVTAVKAAAGVDVTIERLSFSFLKQTADVRGVRVYNPAGFPAGEIMADIPEIALTMDVPALFKQTLHVPYMRIHLQEIRVIRNSARALNVNALKFTQAPDGKNADGASVDKAREMKMQLDLLVLDIGKVVMEDYTSGKEQPRVTVLQLNIRGQEFRNIRSPAELGAAVFVQALVPAGIDGLASFGSRMTGLFRKLVH